MAHRPTRYPGRGALSNPAARFAATAGADFDDGWATLAREALTAAAPPTRVHRDPSRQVITRNDSPDVAFSASINPYKGCSHGCVYCFARPTHEYLDHSAGLDFETEIYAKPDAASRFEAELRAPGYRCTPITLGANTDPYQPDEKHLGITRALLAVAERFGQPISIVTKSALVARDIDILGRMAARDLASVYVSLTSLDPALKRSLEPRAASPAKRLATIEALAAAGVPVGALIAPIIPGLTDAELEALVERAAAAGATRAGTVMLRLPHGVKQLFRDWLDAHYPQRAAHVMSLVNQMHGGRDYDPAWGTRMTGRGRYAELIAQRFRLARRRAGLGDDTRFRLATEHFAPPPAAGDQHAFDFGD